MMYGLRDEFPYFECGACKCLQIQDFPEDMAPYYPANYYSFSKYDGKKFKGFLGAFKKRQYANAMKKRNPWRDFMSIFAGNNDFFIFEGLGLSSDSRILDVGCGNGRSFLYPLAEIGFRQAHGCDPYLPSTITYSNGLQIDNNTIFEQDGKWDLITYHHSFEHIPNPVESLQKVSELLKPNGVCVLRIPTVSSFAWEHYRTNWAQLDAPRHFFLHSRESMAKLADLAGLELYKTVYDSTHFQFSGSEKYVRDTALTAPRPKGFFNMIERKMKKRSYTRRAKQLNREGRGDQAAFFFRK